MNWHRPSYVLSGPRGWPEMDNGDVPVPSVVSNRFARLPCFELLCTNILSDIAINGPSTATWVAITTCKIVEKEKYTKKQKMSIKYIKWEWMWKKKHCKIYNILFFLLYIQN